MSGREKEREGRKERRKGGRRGKEKKGKFEVCTYSCSRRWGEGEERDVLKERKGGTGRGGEQKRMKSTKAEQVKHGLNG